MNENNAVKVIAVSGGKGGVGKTNVSVNLAVELAKSGKSVMLFDADLGMANVDIMLGLKPKFDLQHVITGECTLEEVIIKGPHGIDIIPASSGIGRMANLSVEEQGNLIRAFGELNNKVDILIVDTAAGISSTVVSFAKAAQEVVVVVCDEPASITDAYALIKVLNTEHGVNSFQVLTNMVKNAQHGKTVYARLLNVADTYLNVSLGYLGSIPMDEKLRDAVRKQSAVVDIFPASSSSIAFQQLAQRVNKLPMLKTTTGYLEFFIERIAAPEDKIEGLYQ
ncbi:MAG: cobyrinic acid a,c-diamide synthase [SAR86 cluster bacterium]|uniref:Cobyrinic acid a,c-diamide synthase n=1 Tax=SAR86 cluster bacterium TaxID=2030880 RepID=A0A2A5B522_9GAMM|nr:MAG: cobyrinic acid a,c-diamide synthase [SAR86 cluster bacterium]